MPQSHLVAIAVAAVIAIGLSVTSADARKKPQASDPAGNADVPSLDGRVLGRPRTCGFDLFQYDSSGSTVGPYCH
jgi:hypothetical protein